MTTRTCTKCNTTKPLSSYYTKNSKGRIYWWCKSCMSQATIDKHRIFKLKAVEYKGSKCINCGYNKCMRALVFHHIDPSQKDFGISADTSRNWKKVVAELDKCVLLCHNCHAEVHEGLIIL